MRLLLYVRSADAFNEATEKAKRQRLMTPREADKPGPPNSSALAAHIRQAHMARSARSARIATVITASIRSALRRIRYA